MFIYSGERKSFIDESMRKKKENFKKAKKEYLKFYIRSLNMKSFIIGDKNKKTKKNSKKSTFSRSNYYLPYSCI